jgi:hypothetical protein
VIKHHLRPHVLLKDHGAQSSPLGGRRGQPETGEEELPPRERRTHRSGAPLRGDPAEARTFLPTDDLLPAVADLRISAPSTDLVNPTPVGWNMRWVCPDAPEDTR